MRKAKIQMKKAMRKYQLNVKGRVDRVLFGRASIFPGGQKSFGNEIDGVEAARIVRLRGGDHLWAWEKSR